MELKMLKVYCCFFVVLIFVSLTAGSSANSQSSSAATPPPTVEQLNSCAKCLTLDTNQRPRRWCIKDGAGCTLATDCTGFGSSARAVTATPCPEDGTQLANCNGCIAGGNTWCVVKFPGATKSVENKCIPKVETSDLPKGSINCRHGQIYNQCPSSADDKKPVPLSCNDCIGKNNMEWCRMNDFGGSAFCRHVDSSNPTCSSTVATGGNCGQSSDALNEFKIAFALPTIEQVNSCAKCIDSASGGAYRRWCVKASEFQGCTVASSCAGLEGTTATYSIGGLSCPTDETRFSNCDGCTKAGHNWCVVKFPVESGLTVESKCVPDASNKHVLCRNGELFTKCKKSSISDRTSVPVADADLNPVPLYPTCDACVGVSGMAWCIIESPPDFSFSQYCRASEDVVPVCTTKATLGGCGILSEEKKVFKYSYPPQTCKNCVLDASDSWCSGSEIVDFKGCIKTSDAPKKCPGLTHTRDCSSHLDESAHPANPRSKTCDFCQAFNDKWCKRTDGSGANAATGRACFAGDCPLESTAVVSCDSARSDFYTYLPAVPQELPGMCKQCKRSQMMGAEELNAWCYADEVRTCLPSWSFGFYCPKNGKSSLNAECPAGEDESRKFVENPLVLPQTCDQCVLRSSWCLTEFSNNKFQFCVTDATKALCTEGVKHKLVTICSGLKDEEKKALIPTPVPRKCKECVGKGGWKWCVHSGYGDKIRICIPTEAVKTLCSDKTGGVAFHHCQIAAEDQEISVGLYQLPVDGSAAFASLSLMAIAVAVGFSL